MKKIVLSVLAVLLLGIVIPAAAQDTTVPRFEESATCNFSVPKDQTPKCGYLIVPEDRSNPSDTKTIKLDVAIFPAKNADKAADPVIYLDGGPGGETLETANLEFNDLFAPFQDNNDVILFDQRGVGSSDPSLDCKETTDLAYSTLDTELTPDEYLNQYEEALKACATRLAGQGVDLAAYNSAQSAADVADLRTALGYDKLNLFGISYGTRLALTILRDHPEIVRSAIIDSVVPLQGSYFDAAKSTQRVLDTLFQGCAADTACNKAYPDLENDFYGLVKQLNDQPVEIKVPNLQTGGQTSAVVDGDAFVGAVFQAFYLTDLIPDLPKDIEAIKGGDYTFLITMTTLQLVQLNYISEGMYMAVQCKEEIPFDTADSINAILKATRPELVGFVRRELVDPSALTACQSWDKGTPNPVENQPVTSDIPTLVMTGEYDPVTPPDNAKEVAQTLSKSFLFEFPGTGHGVIPAQKCALGIAQAFLADPTTKPDSSCLSGVKEPAFTTPDTVVQSGPITMTSFTEASMGISGVVPQGWKEVSNGTFSRANNGADQTAIAYQVVPGMTADTALPLLANQFGITDTTGTTYQANGLTWHIVKGDFGGVKVDLALADGHSQVFVIFLLSNNAAEEEQLYNDVLLPSLDGFQPLT